MEGLTLEQEGERLGIRPPTPATLRRYGLTATRWLEFMRDQGWRCPICLRRVSLWNVDHDHFPGWKRMPPNERVRHVRGVLCAHCNFRKVANHRDPDEAQRIADYLKAHKERRDNGKAGR